MGPVLLHRTTPHSSTGEVPFYLFYGRDARLPTALDFKVPTVKYPIVATEYAKEVLRELKRARAVAKDNIQKAQNNQKRHYDHKSKERELKVGDLVMLKVQPRFKLDRCYKGPFTVESLIATNAVIKVRGDNSAEPWNVSRQRLSKCHPGMEQVKPWIGPTNKLRHRRRIKHLRNSEEKGLGQNHSDSNQQSSVGIQIRCGRTIRKPPCYLCVHSSKMLSSKEWEVVRREFT